MRLLPFVEKLPGVTIKRMNKEMWSLDEEGRIYELLRSALENGNYVHIWQRSRKNTSQAKGVIKKLDHRKCEISFSKRVTKNLFVVGEVLYIHCEGIDIIFKKENFSITESSIVFKTPTKLLIKEKRRIERLKFKYQDFKEVEFSFNGEGNDYKMKQTLLDISILGIGFLAPKFLSKLLNVGDEIVIHMMSDQHLEQDMLKAKIVNKVEDQEGSRYSDDYIKYGVEFEVPMDIITYHSKDLIFPKVQRKNP